MRSSRSRTRGNGSGKKAEEQLGAPVQVRIGDDAGNTLREIGFSLPTLDELMAAPKDDPSAVAFCDHGREVSRQIDDGHFIVTGVIWTSDSCAGNAGGWTAKVIDAQLDTMPHRWAQDTFEELIAADFPCEPDFPDDDAIRIVWGALADAVKRATR